MTVPALRVLVAGDSALVRSVLRAALAGSADVTTAADAEQVRALGPDVQVLVSGVDVGGVPLVDLLPGVLSRGTRVVVVCTRASVQQVPELLLHGAGGHLVLEECTAQQLTAAVEDAALGVAHLHPGVATLILQQWRDARSSAAQSLTAKEREVLQAMTTGEPVKTIARQLGLSARTVDSHRSRIYVKLGVRTHAQAVQRASELGLLG
ncbi:response regulator transcription factor [Modestobacter versicolor]|uniref:response regulator transcription factor n=1 Tax=Modestobacter versicolor TaxID=429133 RepID=UPI0034DE617D